MRLLKKREDTKEIERVIRFKQGLAKVHSYTQRLRQAQKKLWDLGNRSASLGDNQQFKGIARGYLEIQEMISRWERYLIAAETVAVRRDQVKVTKEFLNSMSCLSESMVFEAKPEDVLNMQIDIERALGKAQALDETLSGAMDTADISILSGDSPREDSLNELEKAMAQGLPESDSRITEGLKSIEAIKKQMS